MAFKHRLPVRLAMVAAFAAGLLASGCSMFLLGARESATEKPPAEEPPEDAFSQIISVAATVNLAWDPSAGDVASYKVFFRQHGTGDWTLFTEIPAQADPAVTLHQADFGNGSFDFGVEAVADTGAESPMHTSLDPTAQPTSGWYLTWDL